MNTSTYRDNDALSDDAIPQHRSALKIIADWLIARKSRIVWIIVYIALLVIIYALLYFRFDRRLVRRIRETEHNLATNDKLASLINASGIENIPKINIVTTSPAVEMANDCGKGPVSLGSSLGNDADCVRVCASSTAKVLLVEDSSDFYFNQLKLEPGAYCTIGPKPQCNLLTTTVILTINSLVCRSRDPRVFGGQTGNSIVACNNRQFNDPLNELWDTLRNRPVTAASIERGFNVDDKLPNGDFRYACRFRGKDAMGNAFVQHPIERLHPMRNYCASEYIFSAHRDVKVVIDHDEDDNIKDIRCDCGDYATTRVKNVVLDDQHTPCSPKWKEHGSVDAYKHYTVLPYKCFNINSLITDVTKMFPCTERFTEHRSPVDSVRVEYSYDVEYPIESPAWEQLKGPGFRIQSTNDTKLC